MHTRCLQLAMVLFLLSNGLVFAQATGTRPATTRPAQAERAATAQRRSAPPSTSRRPYTAPSAAVRGASYIVGSAAAASIGAAGGGREAAEAGVAAGGVSSFGGVAGASGLSAPQAFSVNGVVSQPGIQTGRAFGLGPQPRSNIFSRTVNPISGPNGGCSALARAGFFPSGAACQMGVLRR